MGGFYYYTRWELIDNEVGHGSICLRKWKRFNFLHCHRRRFQRRYFLMGSVGDIWGEDNKLDISQVRNAKGEEGAGRD